MERKRAKLRKYRRMGSMEQLFTVCNDLKVSWGACVNIMKINKLSTIPINKIQKLWNIIHYKYEALQTQFLTVDSVYEYDWIYIGCIPFKIIQYNANNKQSVMQLFIKELNHRFVLLNDINLTETHMSNHKNYNINNIPQLYRVFICNDYILYNANHAISDGLSAVTILQSFLHLLNNEKSFDNCKIKYESIEQRINPKYATSTLKNKLTNYLVPSAFAMKFSRFYSNNSFLRKYNPLSMHNDDLLLMKYIYSQTDKSNEILSFPLPVSIPYNKFDFNVDYVYFMLNKIDTANLIKQCRKNLVHTSSLLQYVTNAAMIECHSDILNKEYYKTIISNTFTAIPLYKNKNKPCIGCHACAYYSMVEYYKNIKFDSLIFWESIRKISKNLVKDDDKIVNMYKNKFPWMNFKKIIKWGFTDCSKQFGHLPVPSTVSNMGSIKINKETYNYKVKEFFGSANPGVGYGAVYLCGASSIKGIDKMHVGFIYGTQYLKKNKAMQIIDKIKEKLQSIAQLPENINIQSKL